MPDNKKNITRYPYGCKSALSNFFLHGYEKIAGFSISKHLLALEESQYYGCQKIRTLQENRLSLHLAYAYQKTPYWQGIFSRLGYKPDIDPFKFLTRIPILDKGGLRQHMPQILVKSYGGKTLAAPSSGSTGEPITMYLDTDTYSLIKANLFRMWGWAGYRLGDPWIWVKTDKHNNLIFKIRDWAFNCQYFSVFKFGKKGIIKILKKLQGKPFAIIRGYASGIYVIAKTMLEEELADIRVQSVVTSGDNLFPEYRKVIESAFKCKVHDNYGGDVFSVAGQCEYGNYHLNNENIYIEIVNDDNNPVPLGQLGHVIVTEFNNRFMPLFRYRIGDMARLKAGSCSCGRGLSLLGAIEGRDSDLIVLPNRRTIVVHFFTIIFENMQGVDQFQIIQEEPLRIIIRLQINDHFNRKKDEKYLLKCLKESAGPEVVVDFEYYRQIPLSPGGKRRFVISRVRERHRHGLD